MIETLTYHTLLSDLLTQTLTQHIKQAEPGHCLRLEGLPSEVLHRVCLDLRMALPNTRVVMLSNAPQKEYEVTATKLIALRNAAEETYVLLVLIPSNLRTAAEDSFDQATFHQIEIDSLQGKIVRQLEEAVPSQHKFFYERVKSFFNNTGRFLNKHHLTEYLFACGKMNFSDSSWGRNLYFLNLIPDDTLFTASEKIEQRLHNNAKAVERLKDQSLSLIGRILTLEIENNTLQKTIYEFFNAVGDPENVRKWGEAIAANPSYFHLNLSKWAFTGLRNIEELQLFVEPLKGKSVTYQDSERRIVTKEGRAVKVTIGFSTKPGPMEINALKFFKIDLMRTGDTGFEWVETLAKFKKSAGGAPHRTKQVTLNPAQIAEGVYFFRVLALDEAGTILNRNDAYRDPVLQQDWQTRLQEQGDTTTRDGLFGKLTSDSDDFYFRIEGSDEEITEDQNTGRKTKASSLFQANVKAHLDYLQAGQTKKLHSLKITEKTWTDKGESKKSECSLEVSFNDIRHVYDIPFASQLRALSWYILNTPHKLGTFRIDFSHRDTFSQEPHIRDNQLAEAAPAYFLAARKAVFDQILSQVSDIETGKTLGIIEVCDLLPMAEQIESYLAAYDQWVGDILAASKEQLDENLISVLKQVQLLDHAEIIIPKVNGQRERVFLLTPLHPLRLAWFLQLQYLFTTWEEKSLTESQPKNLWTGEVQELFLGGLQPSNHPLLIHGNKLRPFHYAGEVAPGWGLYVQASPSGASSATENNRNLLWQVQNALGIPNLLRDESDFSHRRLYTQIKRYLVQHPYIEVLHINVFNPGDGRKLVECLKSLQGEGTFDHLRYEIRFIAPTDHLNEAGSAFDEFLQPSRMISDEADTFILPSSNPLFPKIRFSRNSIEEYQQNPQEYQAHLSLIFDFLPVEAILVKPDKTEKQSVSCHGLITTPVTSFYSPSEGIVSWHRYLSLNDTQPLSEEDTLSTSLVAVLRRLQQIVAISLANKWTQDIPALSLPLKDYGHTLLYQTHEHSDWVITVDRNLGVDLFDSPTELDCLPYLLDFCPGRTTFTSPLFLTTRPSSEIYGLLTPHFTKLQLLHPNSGEQITGFLEAVRSISGSIVLQLLSSPNRALEVIGIGLSRLLLQHLNLLTDHFIIPLDIHQELFEVAQREGGTEQTRQRGDLLLVSCDPVLETIQLQVIEVKCRNHIGNDAALTDLKSQMTQQMDQTISCLQIHFDPLRRMRLDRSLKNQQLAELLDFYLHRARRYNLIKEEAFTDCKRFLSNLNNGYSLVFHRIGLIFEFEGGPADVRHSEEAVDLAFFHVGRPLIEKLIHRADQVRSTSPKQESESSSLSSDLECIKSLITKHSRTSTRALAQGASAIPELLIKNALVNSEMSNIQDECASVSVQYPDHCEPTDQSSQSQEVKHQPAPSVVGQSEDYPPPRYTDLIGDSESSPQYGILASADARRIALDLNGCNTISLFGVPGGGKSYTIGTILEMAIQPIPGINKLLNPLAAVVFHFNESQDYSPEYVSMERKNTKEREIALLERIYGAKPDSLKDILLLVPADKIPERQKEFPRLNIAPIAFSSQELLIKDWKFLMGAFGNQAMYIQHLNLIMKKGRNNLTIDFIRREIDASETLNNTQKEYAQSRIELASQFINDKVRMRELMHPGRLIIVDLRDEFIEKEQALGLFVVMLNIFAGAKADSGSSFNKLIVFDEAHKYITHSELTSHVVEVIRQMRHQGVTMLIASQDPPSLPNAVIELSSALILHRFNSPQWLKHIQKSVIALEGLTTTQLTSLQPGEAYLWANKATNSEWTKRAIKVVTRPRVTMHGGNSQQAVTD